MNPHLLQCPSFFRSFSKKSPQFTLILDLFVFPISLLILMAISSYPVHGQESIHLGTLLDEMMNLERLTTLPSKAYRVVQYSSYDRRSQKAGMKGWFSNSDGFGGEPIAGFQEIIQQPDEAGSGRYLICDVSGPGTILRLWTAGINGNIRLFLDDM